MWVANAVSPITVETPESARASDVLSLGGITTAYVSSYVCRDLELVVKMGGGRIAIRYDATSGSALCLTVRANGAFEIGQQPSGIDLTNSNSLGGFDYASNLTNFGWTTKNTNDVFTLGCVGFTLYVKWNGTTIYSSKHTSQIVAGKCIVWTSDGATDVTINYLPATMIGSNRDKKLYDIRDFGAKTSSITTTGSMSAGSNVLNVASASGFAIGDPIIVEVGGEAGQGWRGTEGVSGAWPATSFANTTDMFADTSKAVGTYAWDRSTGNAYEWTGTVWDNNETGSRWYYVRKALPKALLATITGISGNAITLDKSAVVATVNANIYVDNTPAFYVLRSPFAPPYGAKVYIPDGLTFAVGTAIYSDSKHGVTVLGSGTLFSPRGCASASVQTLNSNYTALRDFTLIGNHKMVSNGEVGGFLIPGMEGTSTTAPAYNCGAKVFLGRSCYIDNVTVVDAVSQSINIDVCTDAWGRRCTMVQTYGRIGYLGWDCQLSGCFGGGFIDCTMTGLTKLVKTFEAFVCYPDPATGLGPQIIRCGGQNALFSTNNSIGMKVLEPYTTITADAYGHMNAGAMNEPIIWANANSYHEKVDAYIRNPRIIQVGYTQASTSRNLPAIIVSPDCVGVVIEGAYAGATTPFSNALGGYIEVPDYSTASAVPGGNVAILDQGKDTTIRGIRAVGASASGYGQITNANSPTGGYSGGTGTGTIQDCISDTFLLRTGTVKSGNRTNAGASVP